MACCCIIASAQGAPEIVRQNIIWSSSEGIQAVQQTACGGYIHFGSSYSPIMGNMTEATLWYNGYQVVIENINI